MLTPALRGARAATVFLTRLPAGGHPFTAAEMAWAPVWFPAIGGAIGVVLAGLWLLAAQLGEVPAAAIAYTASLLLTGALHEDGLADTADALGGGRDRTRVLEILKDSRVGSFGALALIASFTLRIVLLAEVHRAAPLALILSQLLARLPPVWLLATVPYVTPRTTSKSAAVTRVSRPRAVLASVPPAIVLAALAASQELHAVTALTALASLGALTIAAGALFRARAGGLTGDFLGATEQASEAVILMILLAATSSVATEPA